MTKEEFTKMKQELEAYVTFVLLVLVFMPFFCLVGFCFCFSAL